MEDHSFEQKILPLDKIDLELVPRFSEEDEDRHKITKSNKDRTHRGDKVIKSVIIDGEPIPPSTRFWTSLYSRFGLNRSFFRFFDHQEVFDRIAERENNSKVRVTVENSASGKKLLAATNPNKPCIIYDDLLEVINRFRYDGDIHYNDGIITTTHTPIIGANQFDIGGDTFSNKFVLHAPIDGYGEPNIYLSLLRLICSNGAIGWANSFKTTLQLGAGYDNIRFALTRALEGFTNDEGFAAMRNRFEVAQHSWASVREQNELYKLLIRLQNDKNLRAGAGSESIIGSKFTKDQWVNDPTTILRAYENVTGNPYEIYVVDPAVMSTKQQRSLPVACKVYDIINFATEIATHHVGEYEARKLQAWVGEMISNEYDLEGSCERFDTFRDMFLKK